MNMKARNILIVALLLTTFWVQLSEAQRTFPSQNKASLKTEGHGVFWQSPSLGLTGVQIEELESLRQAFIAEATPQRRGLMFLRVELRYSIRDPNVPAETLYERQRKISELQGKLESLFLSYQVKARSIFTKEQVEQLPEDFLLGIEPGFGMDAGTRRGVWKGSHR